MLILALRNFMLYREFEYTINTLLYACTLYVSVHDLYSFYAKKCDSDAFLYEIIKECFSQFNLKNISCNTNVSFPQNIFLSHALSTV
jgi:hypothetical protein